MNSLIIKSYIEEYKERFDQIHFQEIYKWKAIKHFQDNWDINSSDFFTMLSTSLAEVKNLMDSGSYFPKRMLLNNTETNAEEMRALFIDLFDEEKGLIERIKDFQEEMKRINGINFPDRHSYQDQRAVIVYLTLRYPERYFFYKYKMFKDFAQKVELIYTPVAGRYDNLGPFKKTCELIRYEIEKDQELIKLHQNRLDADCYRDKNLNVLTQDFIYAIVKHLNQPTTEFIEILNETLEEEAHCSSLKTETFSINFKPSIINHLENNIKNKHIGDLGEEWVMKKEINFLLENGKRKLAKQVKHVAKEQGDGAGFDILSFDLNGNEKFIEVKTTKGNLNSVFYISRNELDRSKIEDEKYFLYRVYNFNENNDTADLLKIQGNLTYICENPINYKVKLKK